MIEYPEVQELDVQETRRLIGPNSYNDNWDLVRYTSELRDRNGNFYAIVDFNGDEGKIRECPHCLEYEIHNKLQPRILKKGEVKPPDYDMFVQCYSCGNIFPIYEAHFESEIKDSLETVDNPFETESTFLSIDRRKEQRRKGKKPRSKRLKTEEHEDPEIQAAIDKGLSVNILYDSNR
ncbi:MAG TPA: hypothetical protein VD710_03035 [Nitrososphaeraceae archaeon]|nr:hypothetical protein [Nitrososphaeraceae archaeon]